MMLFLTTFTTAMLKNLGKEFLDPPVSPTPPEEHSQMLQTSSI